MSATPAAVLHFWFEAGPSKWFKKDVGFDKSIVERFGERVEQALAGELDHWGETPSGALALVVLLDQFTRNIWRNEARAYGGDEKAMAISKQAIVKNWDMKLSPDERRWFYMPFMHSEDLALQNEGLVYFSKRLEEPDTLAFAKLHADIIERFGRFPHRNGDLGRKTSDAEMAFLEEGGFNG